MTASAARVADTVDEATIERRWLRLLYRALVDIRACACTDPARAEAIADALHDVPDRLAAGDFDEAFFVEAFLEPLLAQHPDLGEWRALVRTP